jgi:isoleucyl-tRNA synthetase
LIYSVVKTTENTTYIVAKDLISSLEAILGELTTLKEIQGSDLQGLTYNNPLTNKKCPVLMGNHVTNVSGTGLVHTAPAHGMDDYLVCKAQGIHAVNLVNDYGKYNPSAGEELQGKSVLGEGNQLVIDKLTQMGHLIHEKQIVHSYPYDWRTKKPVIQRATPQWFANLEGLSSKALDSLKNVETIPPSGKNRLQSFIGLRTEWCVSRQRAWGVPIPVFYDTETGEALLTPDSIDFVIGKLSEFDIDAWWTLPVEDLIHPKYLESGKKYVKGFDTLDVWFDSGTSWTLINELFPRDSSQPVADVYFEGSDQHRGWFQSSLLTSISQVNKAPFKTLITHGFVLDNKGQKMSKSLGNIIEPKTVINGSKGFPQYGADLLRYWAASSEFVKEVSVGKESLKIINNTFKKLRNTSRFLLGNLNEFNPKTQTVEYNKLTELDKFALHQLYQFHMKVTNHYNKYQFNQVVQELNRYTSADLSSFYLDCRKDRLYADDPSSVERLSTQTVLFEILKVYNQSLAPLVPHLAEEIFDFSKNLYELKSPENPSIFHNQWAKLPTEWDRSNSEFDTNWQFNLKLRNLSNRVVGQARDSGFLKSSLEVELALSFQNLPGNIQFNEEELSQLCITSNVSIISPEEFESSNIEFKLDETLTLNNSDVKVLVGVRKSKGFKCPRCWVYSAKSENCLCSRCSKVVKV